MPKLAIGSTMPDFAIETPYGITTSLRVEAAKGGKTAVVFMRYFGCTLCQYGIHLLADGYERIEATGGRALVVLQSTPESVSDQLEDVRLPFDLVCDPQAKLYHQFEIGAAASMEGLAGPTTMETIKAATAGGFEHGAYEGDELQLPATFVVTSDLTVTYAHYGTYADDTPSVDELAKLLA